MIKQASVLAAVVALASALPFNNASATHLSRVHARHHGDYVVLHRGYGRRGPATGLHFGFVTYAGDPFSRNDYFDGHRCFYRDRHDYCLNFNPPLDPFGSVR